MRPQRPPAKKYLFAFFLLLGVFHWPFKLTANAKTPILSSKNLPMLNLEGSFLVRSYLPQIQSKTFTDFSNYSQLYLKGEFQSSNKLKSQINFILSKYYKIEPQENLFQIFPSFHWLIQDTIELKIGRILYDNNKEKLLSLNPYEAYWYSLDGFLMEYNTQIINFDLWLAYLPKRWLGQERVQEFVYGTGVFLDILLKTAYIDSFNFHLAYLANPASTNNSNKMSRYGLSLKGNLPFKGLSYFFSIVAHSLELQFKPEESMYHTSLHYKNPSFFNAKFFVGYHKDSLNYNPWLYNRHAHAGRADFFQWGNLSYSFGGLSFSPFKKMEIRSSFYHFNSTKEGAIQLGSFGSFVTKQSLWQAQKEEHLGKEWDLQIAYQATKEFEIQLLASLFLAQSETDGEKFHNNAWLAGFYKF